MPVLGNGDIWESFDALRMMRSTGCAGVIVGRGCLGRPWLFGELADVFNGQEPGAPPNFGQIVQIMMDHGQRLVDLFGETVGVRQMRKWTAWYTKGFRGSASVRGKLMRIESLQDIQTTVAELTRANPFRTALRAMRAKGSKVQTVKLPEGYLDELDDDTPPKGPRTLDEIEAWRRLWGLIVSCWTA